MAKYGVFCSLHLAHPSVYTQSSEHTHTEQWAANAAVPGEQLGVRYLAQGSHISCGIEGEDRALDIHSPL